MFQHSIATTVATLCAATILLNSNSIAQDQAIDKHVVIDMHTHVFNVNHLPICGIGISWGFSPATAAVIDTVLTSITKESKFKDLKDFDKGESPKDYLLGLLAQVKLTRAQKTALMEDADEFGIKSTDSNEQKNLIFDLMYEKGFLLEKECDKIPNEKPKDSDYARFIITLTRQERTVVDYLEGEFPETDLFIHSMLDMQKAYNDKPNFGINKQIQTMSGLTKEQGGNLLTFVAYDPFRRESALDPVKKAIELGAIGVKLYPPSGYKAAGNYIDPDKKPKNKHLLKQWKSRYGELDGPKLDEYCENLFDFCDNVNNPALSIPILTHCENGGVEAEEDYGCYSDSKNWVSVLKKHEKLKLCLGHAGGYDGWYEDISNWHLDPVNLDQCNSPEERAFQLAIRYENVYLEFGYHKKMTNPEKRNIFIANLTKLLNHESEINDPNRYKLADKIMFGTDWHMCSKFPVPSEMYTETKKVFETNFLKDYREKFFSKNASKFLGLNDLATGKRGNLTSEQKLYLTNLITRIESN